MLGMAELYLARPDPNIYNFVNTQLLSNVYNNVDDSWLFGMWWGGPVRPLSPLSLRSHGPLELCPVLPMLFAITTNLALTPALSPRRHQQWNETTAGPKTQLNAICLISAAATINADYLSRAGQSVAVGSATDQIAVPESTAKGEAGSTDRSVTSRAARAGWPGKAVLAAVMGAGGAVLWA